MKNVFNLIKHFISEEDAREIQDMAITTMKNIEKNRKDVELIKEKLGIKDEE